MTDPTPTRWRPNRAGIRNVWEYDEQVFGFAGGRMILRGPNGSGKSNALALLFPFLFDGAMSAAAMDPFAGGRSMKSLLLGVVRDDTRTDKFRHDQRLGYVWMEFVGPSGHLTIGCGARATSSGDVRSWFFVTPKRVGFDLDLAPDNTPLTRGKLIEVLGQPAVHDTAEAYRQAIDRELLGLGAEQLTKLNQLIRALRRPQLAGKLDLDALSAVLSSGLPAIPSEMLDDVADSLDDLERVQRELTDVRDALTTVQAFLTPYRRYLTGEAHLRATAVIDADRKVTAEQRRLARLRREHESLEAGRLAVADEERATDGARREAIAERDALQESDRYRSVQELDQVEERARDARSTADGAQRRRADAQQRADEAEKRAEAEHAKATAAATKADHVLQQLIDQADQLDAVWSLPVEEHRDPDGLDRAVTVMVRERQQAVADVRAALRRFEDARRDHARAAKALGTAQDRSEEANKAVAERDHQRTVVHAELAALVETWITSAPALDDDGRDALREQIDLVGTPEAIRLDDRYRQVTAPTRDRLRDDRLRLDGELEAIEAERSQIATERDEVAAEVDPGPTAPAWRRSDRADRPGAPLWACTDFADGSSTDPSTRARIEAALDAAGILDAWIGPTADRRRSEPRDLSGPDFSGPDGPDGLDSWLVVDGAETLAGPTLAELLVPSVPDGSGLEHATVGRVLRSIGLGRLGVAIDAEGRFTLGPLTGRADKTEPEFIGATARAERRERRLRELDATVARLATEVDRTREQRDRRDREIAAIEQAADAAPETTALADATERLRNAQRTAEILEIQRVEAADTEATAAAALATAADARTRIAGANQLPAEEEELGRVESQIQAFAGNGKDAVSSRRDATAAALHASEADRARERAAEDLASFTAEAEVMKAKADDATTRATKLRATVGADATAVIEEIQQLSTSIEAHEKTAAELRSRSSELDRRLGSTSAEVASAAGRIEAAAVELNARTARLPVLRRRDVLALLVVEADDPTDDPTADPVEGLPVDPVELAGWLSEHIDGATPSEVEHARANRALDQAVKLLLDDLHRGYSPGIVHLDDIVTIEVTADEGTFGLAVLVERLAEQVASMERHLTDGDREVFERHLLNRISHELRRLLGDADEFVLGVNRALEETRTASGLRVELAWAPDTDDRATATAIGLLRRDTEQMGDDDRAALRAFFDQAIRRQRAEEPEAGYRATLEQVLDYRRWHRFQPYLHSADGGRAKLTRSKFRELSGGEQAVALHLPLFAAAAAHYDRAADHAPRLVALDEAFAGIDEAMRGELLALTVEFDLDVLLTGHELWGAYAEVPEIAVHDLLRRPPAEGVSVFTLRWNGEKLVDAPVEPTSSSIPAPAIGDGLFAADPADPADPNR